MDNKMIVFVFLAIIILSGCSKDDSYLEKALETKDAAYCKNIKNELSITSCYEAVALLKHDITICKSIDDPFFNDVCRFKVIKYSLNAMTEDNAVTECKTINDPSTRCSCFTKTAIIKKNPLLCSSLAQNDRDCCEKNIAEENKEPNCEVIAALKNSCYSGLASEKEDPAICQKLGDTESIKRCLDFIAKMKENKEKDKTLMDRAIAENDAKYCVNIFFNDSKDRCYFALGDI